jgi:hypothetical protein
MLRVRESRFSQHPGENMKSAVTLVVLGALSLAPALFAQSASDYNHIEIGAFADYMNFGATSPHINFVGIGGRFAFNVQRNVQIEAEMSYDFARNFTNTYPYGGTTTFVTTGLRPLTGLFGPKFQTGHGPFRVFATVKGGFVNFSTTNQNGSAGFENSVGNVTNGNTQAAFYPGVGIEGYWGPFGLRLEGGDEIYFDNGTHNNVKATFGPVIRF